jgi:hypothetical protein
VQATTVAGKTSNSPTAAFKQPVTAGHTLVGLFAVAGGGGVTVSSVTDSQGNLWVRAQRSLTDSMPDDAEIWYAHAKSTGSDTVSVYETAGYVQSNLTLAEFTGTASLDAGGGGGGDGMTSFATAPVALKATDFVVAMYVDSGNNGTIAIGDGSLLLGTNVQNTVNTESDQSFRLNIGSGSYSSAFTTHVSGSASVVSAAFTP